MITEQQIKVIAFVGKAGSGKTAAAKYLVDKYGYTRLSFSDGLKKMLLMGLNVPFEHLYGYKKNEPCPQLCEVTARHAMITLGTEWGRNLIHPRIWVRTLDLQMCKLMSKGYKKFVIDDVRFLNEAQWVKDIHKDSVDIIKTRLLRLVRDNNNKIDHQSETEQDSIEDNGVIYNNGPFESLYSTLDKLIF